MSNRAKGMEECPGCKAVEVDGKACQSNSEYCPIAWFLMKTSSRPQNKPSDTNPASSSESSSIEKK